MGCTKDFIINYYGIGTLPIPETDIKEFEQMAEYINSLLEKGIEGFFNMFNSDSEFKDTGRLMRRYLDIICYALGKEYEYPLSWIKLTEIDSFKQYLKDAKSYNKGKYRIKLNNGTIVHKSGIVPLKLNNELRFYRIVSIATPDGEKEDNIIWLNKPMYCRDSTTKMIGLTHEEYINALVDVDEFFKQDLFKISLEELSEYSMAVSSLFYCNSTDTLRNLSARTQDVIDIRTFEAAELETEEDVTNHIKNFCVKIVDKIDLQNIHESQLKDKAKQSIDQYKNSNGGYTYSSTHYGNHYSVGYASYDSKGIVVEIKKADNLNNILTQHIDYSNPLPHIKDFIGNQKIKEYKFTNNQLYNFAYDYLKQKYTEFKQQDSANVIELSSKIKTVENNKECEPNDIINQQDTPELNVSGEIECMKKSNENIDIQSKNADVSLETSTISYTSIDENTGEVYTSNSSSSFVADCNAKKLDEGSDVGQISFLI